MSWFTYDAEVFKYDFVVVFKDKETGEYFVFHNDNDGVKAIIEDASIYCGFNTKGYDQYIIKAICAGFSPEEVKKVNDWIIQGNQGWQCPDLRNVYFKFNNIDITCDMQREGKSGKLAKSLKEIEGHLRLNIEESDVDFNIDRPLTEEELASTIAYCKNDVDATETLTDVRSDYLNTKRNLARRAGIDEVKALALTNAKLTALMLKAKRQEWNDGRDYVYPENLKLEDIPPEVLAFFETIHDMSIPDEELFKTFYEMELGGMLCKWAWGGAHGSLTGYYEEATDDRLLLNKDVSSLYPSLIEIYNYLSRNVPDPQLFYSIRKDRITAKHNNDKQTAKDLKLPLNTVSGAQENIYNDLYDPLSTRSMRISGQLFLTVLTVRLLRACKTIKLSNLNTDGLAFSIDKSELAIANRICAEWEAETKFELETDEIARMWIKDVNNLLIVKTDGKIKTVGGYLNYGISEKGAWTINNNMIIVKKALLEYLVHGTPVEETINNDMEIFDFQIITKSGSSFNGTFHEVNGEMIPVQKVNRVYATADLSYGTIYKVHKATNTYNRIAGCPEHCIIDNANLLTIDYIDKKWYIRMAKKYVNDFFGIKLKKPNGRKVSAIIKRINKILEDNKK